MDHWTAIPRVTYPGQEPWSYLDRPMHEAYACSFYWTLGVMRTMPAEIQPVNLVERVFVLFFMFFALTAFAISVASLTQAYFKIAERSRGFDDEMFAVRMYLKRYGVTKALSRQVKQYAAYLFERRRVMAKEERLLEKLPRDIKQLLSCSVIMKHLKHLDLARDYRTDMLLGIAQACSMHDMLPGELISVAGEPATAAWILVVGKCHVESSDEETVILRAPGVVCKEALQQESDEVVTKCTVTAITCCQAVRIDHKGWFKAVPTSPNMTRKSIADRVSLSIRRDDTMPEDDAAASAGAVSAGLAG